MTPFAVKKATGMRGATPNYIAREGDYERKRDDLVATGGRDREEMEQLLEECHAGTVRKDGVVAQTVILELRHELDVAAWTRICETAAAWFEEGGNACMWAIHNPPKKRGRDTDPDLDLKTQPHAHFIVVARPLVDGSVALGGGGRGKPAEGLTLWGKHSWTPPSEPPHPDSFRALKTRVAQVGTAELEAAGVDLVLHPGKMRDLGIDRKPEERIPAGAWFMGQRHKDPTKVEAAFKKNEAERQRRREIEAAKAAAKTRKTEAEAKKIGMVPAAKLAEQTRRAEAAEQGMFETGDVLFAERAEWDVERQRLLTEIDHAKARSVDLEPATKKQIDTLYDMAQRKRMEIPEDVPLTKGQVGTWIRELKGFPDRPEAVQHASTPQTAQTPADTGNSVPVPPQEAAEPFRCGIMTKKERADLTRKMPTEEIQARHAATKAALDHTPKTGTTEQVVAWIELSQGEEALREALIRRDQRPAQTPQGPKPTGVER